MKIFQDKKGFSIVIALGMVLVLSSISILLLEYIIPFSRNVKGLDNYTKAYYLSLGGVEQTLYFLANSPFGSEINVPLGTGAISYSYSTLSSGSIIPQSGRGESDFDHNWGIIGPNAPVHIHLPASLDLSTTIALIRVPNFDDIALTDESIDPILSGQDIVNWQLASQSDVLNSTSSLGSRIKGSDICTSIGACPGRIFSAVQGVKLDGTVQDFQTFFSNNCTGVSTCILKLSLVNQLLGTSGGTPGKRFPYLEYKIDFGGTKVPYNRVLIDTSGKSYGFKKDFSFDLPLEMINEAFDFTIFQ